MTDPWEPLYSLRSEDQVRLAFDVSSAHCNSRGFLHGGVLGSLCDNVMGLSLGVVLNNGAQIVTIHLSVDYLDSARVGETVLIEPKVIRAGKRLGFCQALAQVGDKVIASAHATFNVRVAETVDSR